MPQRVVAPLLEWTKTGLRDLPWRRTRDPWAILVSETMLQQTQVSRVIDRYHEFLERFPTPASCAAAPTGAVIELWAGLGYNRRAVNLWKAAGVIARDHNGTVPADLDALLGLPGVGPYTARAIQVFAFECDTGVVDTNVGRLLARWGGERPTAAQGQAVADSLVPEGQGWRWNQGLFDFAVAVCTKRDPACGTCVLRDVCAWSGRGADPAESSAGVSTRQSKFEGSERQVRGRIVAALRLGPLTVDDLAALGRPSDTRDDALRIARGLVADGLATRNGTTFHLPS